MSETQPGERILRRICVFLSSSSQIDRSYFEAAAELGRALALHDITVVYGGSSLGPMGTLADSVMEAGGRVIGVIPRFMYEYEWAHTGLTELILVDSLEERKRLMVDEVDGIVALPGGSGTFEELLDAFSLKRLGLYLNPIVVVNQGGYFDPLIEQFERAAGHRFMDRRDLEAWSIVSDVESVIAALKLAPAWDPAPGAVHP